MGPLDGTQGVVVQDNHVQEKYYRRRRIGGKAVPDRDTFPLRVLLHHL
jgi:hypothetical protein